MLRLEHLLQSLQCRFRLYFDCLDLVLHKRPVKWKKLKYGIRSRLSENFIGSRFRVHAASPNFFWNPTPNPIKISYQLKTHQNVDFMILFNLPYHSLNSLFEPWSACDNKIQNMQSIRHEYHEQHNNSNYKSTLKSIL